MDVFVSIEALAKDGANDMTGDLDHEVRAGMKIIKKSLMLQMMRNKLITSQQFKFYVIQKLNIAESFENLLENGIKKSKLSGDTELTQVLQDNLSDERGIDAEGNSHIEYSHHYWRTCFIKALNLNFSSVFCKPINEAKQHGDSLNSLAINGNYLNIAGAILMTECLVPMEYRAVQASRDHCFREIFLMKEEDSYDTAKEKTLARHYIDDHISHDSKKHFPDCLKALKRYENDRVKMQFIKEGMYLVIHARNYFFNAVSNFWLKTELREKT